MSRENDRQVIITFPLSSCPNLPVPGTQLPGAGARKLTALCRARPRPPSHPPPCTGPARLGASSQARPILDCGGRWRRREGERKGGGVRRAAVAGGTSAPLRCWGKVFPASPAEHTHPRRQVWTALCQQSKINKILSARNLLKHIHLAVLGKESQEEGSREEASPHDILETESDPEDWSHKRGRGTRATS